MFHVRVILVSSLEKSGCHADLRRILILYFVFIFFLVTFLVYQSFSDGL